MGSFFSKSTSAREGRGKDNNGRKEGIGLPRAGQKPGRNSKKQEKAKQQSRNLEGN